MSGALVPTRARGLLALALAPSLALVVPLALALTATAGCQRKPRGHPGAQGLAGPAEHTRRDTALPDTQARALAHLAALADASPEDFGARKASGLAHMDATLAGALSHRERAELDLEAAFALDPNDRGLTRSLGRFYNLRAVAGDSSKADMQVAVYSAYLGVPVGESPSPAFVAGLGDLDFVAYSFFELGQILRAKNEGKLLRALGRVKALEAALAQRTAAHPDNVEFQALAGNFAFFFAGNIPMERERRVAEAVAYFEVLRARWDELRPGARDPLHCPNTYENFMFELAEGYAVLGREAQARALYAELSGPIAAPRTRPKELIAHVSAERLRNLDAYLGQMRLMPPWPSDVGNCVVCHAWQADLPLDSLYSVEAVDLADLPSRAALPPSGLSATVLDPSVEPPRIRDRGQLPPRLAEVIEAQCSPCHFSGGAAVEVFDLSNAATLVERAEDIEARVSRGDMPPEGLPEPERALVREWAQDLARSGQPSGQGRPAPHSMTQASNDESTPPNGRTLHPAQAPSRGHPIRQIGP